MPCGVLRTSQGWQLRNEGAAVAWSTAVSTWSAVRLPTRTLRASTTRSSLVLARPAFTLQIAGVVGKVPNVTNPWSAVTS
ncbi:hypothetical protein GCM10011581_17000 [Saccharopolyspora subtropica]|uniref:Uncharacterized protein n=1 Tax=Saccharopolyspora thermophila TaxID=89367 RepID=A0A917N9Z8_9PSEU|nr:hypothetical protein GCM10011581_17000 [Saccharopolyspora subtropica]